MMAYRYTVASFIDLVTSVVAGPSEEAGVMPPGEQAGTRRGGER